MDAALTLASLGEDAVVAKLVRLLPALSPSVITGPGDDCAVVQHGAGGDWTLLKADSVVEGVHFLAGERMSRVGWKALCRAISDVAAMGGIPEHALVTLALAPGTPWADLQELYKGIKKAARRFGVTVVGGETGKTRGPMVCSIFLTGRVSPAQCVWRSGGSPGDVLFVTGRLGGSFESGRHLDFVPRLAEARWLAEISVLQP